MYEKYMKQKAKIKKKPKKTSEPVSKQVSASSLTRFYLLFQVIETGI